ncbi:gliding motility protein GldB-related protein [Jiulongibacter sp. NS-SX5]|uniref:gliding motility protein GldB-related protein n=1 Tax=Jiulongibacter sp. NS-SX5 TaxID=3463854 RepID=UPI004058AB95
MIQSTKDTSKHREILNDLYLNKASEGLNGLISARNYSENEFLDAIRSYPSFWASIRSNTEQVADYESEIEEDIQKLKTAYPDLKPTTIYFTMGAFRTNGTVYNGDVLVGSELALADQHTVIDELPDWRQPFYKEYKPLQNLALLCTHEYIHTQQKEMVYNLLSQCLYEGTAEFVSCYVTGKTSSLPAIKFGKKNQAKVVKKYVEDLYLRSNDYNWLWGENRNELEVRDLGYWIGYEIAERYFNKSSDKKLAIKELIELDYTNEDQVEHIVDQSSLLPETIESLYQSYEKSRPRVIKIAEFENRATDVDPGIKSITVYFSDKLNGIQNGLDFGPLGGDFYPEVDNSTRKWGDDLQSYSFEVNLQANKHYQLVIGSNFRLVNGIRLKPYLIEFKTK